jgi:hypothetical protein
MDYSFCNQQLLQADLKTGRLPDNKGKTVPCTGIIPEAAAGNQME